jgi:hypothetical protein
MRSVKCSPNSTFQPAARNPSSERCNSAEIAEQAHDIARFVCGQQRRRQA